MRRQLGIFQQQSQNIIDSELLDETVHKKFQRQQSLKKTIELCIMEVQTADYKRELEKFKTETLYVEMVGSHVNARWKEGMSLETKKEFMRIPIEKLKLHFATEELTLTVIKEEVERIKAIKNWNSNSECYRCKKD